MGQGVKYKLSQTSCALNSCCNYSDVFCSLAFRGAKNKYNGSDFSFDIVQACAQNSKYN